MLNENDHRNVKSANWKRLLKWWAVIQRAFVVYEIFRLFKSARKNVKASWETHVKKQEIAKGHRKMFNYTHEMQYRKHAEFLEKFPALIY